MLAMATQTMMNVTDPPQFGPPTTLDIVLPPMLFIAFILVCILVISVFTQPKWWQSRCCPVYRERSKFEDNEGQHSHVTLIQVPGKNEWCDNQQNSPNLTKRHTPADHPLANSVPNGKTGHIADKINIFTDEDIDVINKMEEFQNNPISLLCVCIPVIASLALCPLIIGTYGIWMFFWPPEITGPMTNVNDAIGCFLMPAGFVYAIAFGFAFQDVLTKKADMDKCLREHVVLLRQTQELIHCSALVQVAEKQVIARTIKDVVISWMVQLLGMEQIQNKGCLWDAVHTLQQVKSAGTEGQSLLEDTIVQSIYSHLLQLDLTLNENCQKAERSINPLLWIFLELLGFVSFFGVLLLKANSYRVELTMCILTVFSISAFSYILADLDCSYHGVFRLDLMPHVQFLKGLNANSRSNSYKVSKH